MPVVKGNLVKNGTNKIRKNYTYLLSELDGAVLVDYLYQEEVFDLNDKEEISTQTSKRKRTELLLTKLLRAGPYQAYNVFLKTVREHYPHVAERLEETGNGQNVEEFQLQELYYSTQTNKETEEKIKIILYLRDWKHFWVGKPRRLCDPPDSIIPVTSFNIEHLPEGFQYEEVVDCVKSLAEQTVIVMGLLDLSKKLRGGKGLFPFAKENGRVWRVQRNFSTVDNSTCPCYDCVHSDHPKKQWGEYIVLTRSQVHNMLDCDSLRCVIGYDSDSKLSDVSLLKGVSVTSKDESLDFAEVLCITHDADTSKRVEDICHRSNVNREKLLNRCHLLKKDKKLAVLVSHPRFASKHISVGEWLRDVGDQTPCSSRHAYTAVAAREFCCGGDPVLLVDGGNASVTLHYFYYPCWDPFRIIGKSCGYVWSL